MARLCDETSLRTLIQSMQTMPDGYIGRIETLLSDYPEDARLYLLHGSALVGDGRLIEGHKSLSRAVEIEPDFAIARFQLGLFQLTSGEAGNALSTWGRLDGLPDGHYLRKFVDGLRCLIRDDFEGAIANLREGIPLNTENPPLNNDMQMLIERCLPLVQGGPDADGSVSETSLILSRFSGLQKPN